VTSELELLIDENSALKKRVEELQETIAFYEAHATLFEGVRGESIVSSLVGGSITAYAEGHDIDLVTGEGATRIEVKMASLNVPVLGASTRRWAWGKILGEGGKKEYDWLILVGKKDERYLSDYPEQDVPYIFFLVPKTDVEKIMSQTGRYSAIFLTTNPRKPKRSKAGILYEQYMVSSSELKSRFGL